MAASTAGSTCSFRTPDRRKAPRSKASGPLGDGRRLTAGKGRPWVRKKLLSSGRVPLSERTQRASQLQPVVIVKAQRAGGPGPGGGGSRDGAPAASWPLGWQAYKDRLAYCSARQLTAPSRERNASSVSIFSPGGLRGESTLGAPNPGVPAPDWPGLPQMRRQDLRHGEPVTKSGPAVDPWPGDSGRACSGVTEVIVGGDVYDPAVDFLRHPAVKAAVSGLHVKDGNLQPLGRDG